MGTELFGIDIAGLVAEHVAPGLRDAVITKATLVAPQSGNLTGGRQSEPVVYLGAKGIWEDVPRLPPPGVEILLNDRIAMLIGDTIPAGGIPERGDAIEIDGLRLYAVQLISRDPAAAVYRFLCRDRRGPDGV